jgi:hypothetical protein
MRWKLTYVTFGLVLQGITLGVFAADFELQGRVVRARTTNPLEKVRVEVRFSEGQKEAYVKTWTGPDGHYQLKVSEAHSRVWIATCVRERRRLTIDPALPIMSLRRRLTPSDYFRRTQGARARDVGQLAISALNSGALAGTGRCDSLARRPETATQPRTRRSSNRKDRTLNVSCKIAR